MSSSTTNYNWTIPTYDDEPDIKVLSDTIEAIDGQVKELETNISNITRNLTMWYASGISAATVTDCDYSAVVTGDIITVNFRVVLNVAARVTSTFALLMIPTGYRPPVKTVFTSGYANNKLIPMWVNTGGEIRIRIDEEIPAGATIGGTITYIYKSTDWKTLETTPV